MWLTCLVTVGRRETALSPHRESPVDSDHHGKKEVTAALLRLWHLGTKEREPALLVLLASGEASDPPWISIEAVVLGLLRSLCR